MVYRRWYMNAAPTEGGGMSTESRWTVNEPRIAGADEETLTRLGCPHVVTDYDDNLRAVFHIGEDAERYVRDRNGEAGVPSEMGDAHAEVDSRMRDRLDDLAILIGTAEGKGEGWADPDKLEALWVEDKHADPEIGTAEKEAQERLDEYPLAVEATT